MANERLLTGCDGDLDIGTAGTQIVDTGTLDADTWYRIDQTGSGSVLDSTLVGYLYKADGTEILTTDDAVTPFSFLRIGHISNWELNATKDKYEVTQLANCTKGYIAGLKEVTTSFDGTRDTEDEQQDVIINRFFDIVEDNVIDEIDDTDLYFRLWADKTNTNTGQNTQFYFGKFIADNYTTNSSADAKADFSFAGTVDGANNKFALYKETVA